MTPVKLIAMWSGPRNISTAMMRSWGSRPDTVVHDEPFYAHYLTQTEHDHPGKDEVIGAHETDWRKVIEQITTPPINGKTVYYQKHMTQHMLPHIERGWMLNMVNCFLIREPRLVVQSFAKKVPNPQIDQTGFPQQVELFHYVREHTGRIPPVLDAKDVLMNPRAALSALCEQIGVPFMDEMLDWEPGTRDTDGIWAKYWYASVEQSVGFMPYEDRDVDLPDHLEDLAAQCEALYNEMASYRLVAQ